MKKKFKFVDMTGEGCFSTNGPSVFTFRPDYPEPGLFTRYHKQGTATRTSDGSFEFVENYWTRSHAQLIKKLSHGRLSKTVNGDYLLTIRIPEWANSPAKIIHDDAMVATDALLDYIYDREEAA